MSTLEEIAGDLLETMPEVSDHAISEHEAQNQALAEVSSVTNTTKQYIDDKGNSYNPETHEISPLTGKAIKKRRGGSAKKSSVVPAGKTVTNREQTVQVNAEQQARASGQCAAGLTVALCVGVFGDEFQPVRNAEKDEFYTLERAFGDYFVATGRTDLPPVMGLVVAIGMYAFPRLTQPKTQTKLGALRDWAASKFLAFRSKKAMRSAEKSATENKGE